MTSSLIAIDAGTTGVTGVLFDPDLQLLAKGYREFPQGFPRPGWVEHGASDILAAVDAVLDEVLAHPEAADVAAIGITNQRETVFALDRESGEALGPGIVWQDRRTAERCDELRAEGHADLVRRRTGLLLDPYFSGTKIEWMLAQEPVGGAAHRGEVVFATVDTLVLGHLTGGAVHATDFTNASRTMLFDIDERRWDAELCGLLGVQPAWLPEVRPSSGDFGTSVARVTGGREIPISGVAGDQQAALFGQGCFDEGGFKTTYGTGSFLVLNTGSRRVDSERGLLTTLAVARDGGPCYALEGSVFISGALVQWLRDQMGFFEHAGEIEELARSVEDSGGVTIVPAFTGLGAPYWDPEARGAILGITRGTGRAHVARAALEAIAFQNSELIEILRDETGLPVTSLLADGGATADDLLLQIQADLGGVTVLRPPSVEATARGAAALAGLGIGLWSDLDDVAALTAEPDRFECRSDEAERSRRMAEWRAAVRRVSTR